MRFYLFLSVVASLCPALVIPDQELFAAISKAYLGLQERDDSRAPSADAGSYDDESKRETWWKMVSVTARNRHDSATDLVLSPFGLDSTLDETAKAMQNENPRGSDIGDDQEDGDEDGDDEGDDDGDDDERSHLCSRTEPGKIRGLGHPRHRPGLEYSRLFSKQDRRASLPEIFCPADHTIWELINESAKPSRLADLMKDTDYLVKLLNTTTANHTLFAPTNSALERLLSEEPSTKLLEQIEHYHVVPGLFGTDMLRHHQTLRTTLNESSPGEQMPQRVVVNRLRSGLLINHISRIVAGDILATNGIIHQINIPLIPPPKTSAIIDLLPAQFSSFAHGLELTKLTTHFRKDNRAGGTTFAPTNAAFERLGPHAHAFLFSPQGEQCLRSLLQYHIVLNETLYSDALYAKGDVLEFGHDESSASVHVELPTVLKGHALDVDVARSGPGVEVRVNGFNRVVGLDLLASDGVLHVLHDILIPPKKVGGKVKWEKEMTEIKIEMLKERLGGCAAGELARMEL